MKDPLKEKRKRIDELDRRIARLLTGRFRAAASLRGLKKTVRDQARESVVLKRAVSAAKTPRFRAALLSVYREVIKQSRRLQEKR
jgi:chorismate mutase